MTNLKFDIRTALLPITIIGGPVVSPPSKVGSEHQPLGKPRL